MPAWSTLPIGMADTAFNPDGTLADPDRAAALSRVVDRLLRHAGLPVGAGPISRTG